eukprot:scaffold152298_cov29-Tisochrysis_lutea.AAC.2
MAAGTTALSALSLAAAATSCSSLPSLRLRSGDQMPVRTHPPHSLGACTPPWRQGVQPSPLTLLVGTRAQVVGLGLWKISRQETAQTVYDAIASGYRHFDCACDYGNEAEVGDGFRKAFKDGLVTRDELWVTTKLWNTYHAPEHVEPALRRSLSDLGLDYVDLFLMHFPFAQRFVPFETRYPPEWVFDPKAPDPTVELANIPVHVTWTAMEATVRNGLAKNIGVCNFNSALLRDLIAGADVPPAVLQIELHPYNQQPKLVRFAQEQVLAAGCLPGTPLIRAPTAAEGAFVFASPSAHSPCLHGVHHSISPLDTMDVLRV